MVKCLETSKKIGQLGHSEMIDFLLTFDAECRNNAEYSEWSNEILFELLEKQTELTVKTIVYQEDRIDLTTILENFENPVQDRFDLTALIDKVNKIKVKSDIKDEIIGRLKKAGSK